MQMGTVDVLLIFIIFALFVSAITLVISNLLMKRYKKHRLTIVYRNKYIANKKEKNRVR